MHALSSFQATASPAGIAAALAECARVEKKEGKVSLVALKSLVAAVSPALSSPEVARGICDAIKSICGPNLSADDNRVTCGAAGVVPAVVTAISTHGSADSSVAWTGCHALADLAFENTVNADAIVLATGGLRTILSVMASTAKSVVLSDACFALCNTADAASPAALKVMRESAAVELLHAAKRNYPSAFYLNHHADRALEVLLRVNGADVEE